MSMNQAQIRVIDPILSTVVQGYSNAQMVGSALFPAVPVEVAGGQIIEFGKEAFQLYDTRRAPGAATKRISAGYLGRPYAVEGHALEALVPLELSRDAQLVPGIDLAGLHVKLVQDIHLTTLEVQQAGIARNAANYDVNHKVALTGVKKWSDITSKPLTDVLAAKEAIRASCGQYPTVMLISAKVFAALQANTSVQTRFQYTSSASVTTDMLANFFGIPKVVVGAAVTASDAGVFSDIWGLDVVLPEEPAGNHRAVLEEVGGQRLIRVVGDGSAGLELPDNEGRRGDRIEIEGRVRVTGTANTDILTVGDANQWV